MGENPYQLHTELQEEMQKNAMIARTEQGLLHALEKIQGLQKRAHNLHVEGDRYYNPGWHAARDLHSMLTASEVIVRCALERKESRGAQWRLDYLERDDTYWGKRNLVANKKNNRVNIEERLLPPMPDHLQALIEEYGK